MKYMEPYFFLSDVVITDSHPYLELIVVGNSVDQSTP